jgi:V-type H+-transporting ATPase subunit E
MQTRYELLQKLKGDIRQQLSDKLADPAVYKVLMKKLILQGMIKLLETSVELKCLQKDIRLVESLIPECEQEFTSTFFAATKRDRKTKLNLNKDHFLDQEGKKM